MNRFASIKSLSPELQAQVLRSREAHKQVLSQLRNSCKDETAGFFGPESTTWKFYSEPCILLGSSRALLLQIAHPAIAAGVKSYSNFQQNITGRAHRTFTSMIRIWFGDAKTAINSAKRLYHIHSMIRGTAVWETEDETIIKPFNAADPDLLFWVLATPIDTTLYILETIKGPIPSQEKEQFYEESKITDQLMGIPLETYPQNLDAFYKKYHEVINGKTLYVGQTGAEIAKAVFKVPYPIRWLTRLMASGWLPYHIRSLFGFRFKKMQRLLFSVIVSIAKVNYRIIPDKLRHPPHLHQANYRIAKAKGKKTSFLERLHVWLGENLDFYFISAKLNPRKNA